MEDAVRLIIIVLFIGLIVVAVVFFGVFLLAPLGNVGGLLGHKATSTETVNLPPLNQQSNESGSNATQPNENPPVGNENQSSQPTSAATPSSGVTAPVISSIPGPSLSPGDYRLINQSSPLAASDIPSGAVKLTVTSEGFSPSVITASAGSVVVLAVISGDNETHVFKFDNPDLSSVSVGVGPYGIRTLSFVINKSGVYGFHDDVPGRAQAGVVGRLIIN